MKATGVCKEAEIEFPEFKIKTQIANASKNMLQNIQYETNQLEGDFMNYFMIVPENGIWFNDNKHCAVVIVIYVVICMILFFITAFEKIA